MGVHQQGIVVSSAGGAGGRQPAAPQLPTQQMRLYLCSLRKIASPLCASVSQPAIWFWMEQPKGAGFELGGCVSGLFLLTVTIIFYLS